MPRVSIIISNFNGARFLPRLFQSLREQRGVETELIVVDRQSTDGSAELLAAEPGIVVLTEPPETGLVAGYHAGSARATADLLFFCNEDMWFDPDCLQRLAERIDLPNRVGATDPWQWTYDGSEWIHGGTRFLPARWALNSPEPRRAADFRVPLPAGEVIPFPCAGAVMIHRDVYRELGGWDTSFFLDHEDTDLFLRAWQRGWRSVVVPEAKVYHAVNASNVQTLTSIQVTVSQRRYVSQRANLGVIAVKYFSWQALPWAALNWPAVVLNNLSKGRWSFVSRDFQVLRELVRRLPAAWRFRQANTGYNYYYPGEQFFRVPEFSAPCRSGPEPR
ncbi:MAG: glycosyltransferase family 2 protein [Verrucomicrobia bacterium]|nr:glycosyltransferase family 2 protein [Verrucomicrobiota bacterium]